MIVDNLLSHPEEALYLPTFSHLFDCQKTSLSLSLSLSLSHPQTRPGIRSEFIPKKRIQEWTLPYS